MGRYYMSGEKRCELSGHSEDGGSDSHGWGGGVLKYNVYFGDKS